MPRRDEDFASSNLGFFLFFFAVSCGFTASQELIVSTPGFKPLHRGFLTLSHSAAYVFLAAAELARAGWTWRERTTPLGHYAAVAVLSFVGVYAANASLGYVDYSTRVMFNHFFLAGAACAGASVVADALVSTYEEAKIFSRERAPRPAELILFTYAIAACWSGAVFVASDEPRHAVAFFRERPSILAKMAALELCGYLSISCVVRMVGRFGATHAELVKTARKGVTLAFSFAVLEGKAPGIPHVAGSGLFAAGAGLSVWAKDRKRRRIAAAEAMAAAPLVDPRRRAPARTGTRTRRPPRRSSTRGVARAARPGTGTRHYEY
ncbi:3'-phosphoadenosine 5'-phosphosulfate transmembrane transporter [Aureococcus anophagefferens]|nr:3'-phosphoadenosine 5'-phosphosulfate transmembrane transporter [Aureococcus anophagefferens]